ncbi:fungal hydrophobin [Mycena olivaceomarginata]|nr:fungal hydrophobin [Mycena olivaceomarginata]
MFPKLSLAVTAVLAFQTLAVASPTNPSATTLCCNSIQQSNTAQAAGALALIGAVVDAVVPIGLGCSAITVAGNNCGNQQVACYSPQRQIGLVAIGCLPITA